MAIEAEEEGSIEFVFEGLPPLESARNEDTELPSEPIGREESELNELPKSDAHFCKECGVNEVFRKGTRGRWPNFCSDCRKPRTGGTPKKAKANPNSRLAHIAQGLSHNIALAGIGVSYVAPTAGFVVCDGADFAGKAIVELAKDRPAVLAALETAAKIGPGVELFKWIVTVGIAFAIDFGRIPPDQILAQFLGVTDAYQKTHSANGDGIFPDVVPFPSFNDMPTIPDVG